MIEFVTFKWKPPVGYRSKFGPEHVNTLRSMIARNYAKPHRLTCITDDPSGIDPRVRVLPLWDEHGDVPSPHKNPRSPNPSCYRRLKLWSADARELVGERIFALDLDTCITADLSPIVDRPEPYVLWGDYVNPTTYYNGSFQLLTAGCRPDVWDTFDPVESPRLTIANKFWGSDQAWLCYVLGPDAPRWTREDGVASFRIHCKPKPLKMPDGVRIVSFHGQHDPWHEDVQRNCPWVREHYK